MDDAALYNTWFLALGIAAAVVIIAAALLIAVLTSARNIENGARAALGLVRQIRENTQAIWALTETNRMAVQLEEGAGAILENAGQIAQALHDADVRRGRT